MQFGVSGSANMAPVLSRRLILCHIGVPQGSVLGPSFSCVISPISFIADILGVGRGAGRRSRGGLGAEPPLLKVGG